MAGGEQESNVLAIPVPRPAAEAAPHRRMDVWSDPLPSPSPAPDASPSPEPDSSVASRPDASPEASPDASPEASPGADVIDEIPASAAHGHDVDDLDELMAFLSNGTDVSALSSSSAQLGDGSGSKIAFIVGFLCGGVSLAAVAAFVAFKHHQKVTVVQVKPAPTPTGTTTRPTEP